MRDYRLAGSSSALGYAYHCPLIQRALRICDNSIDKLIFIKPWLSIEDYCTRHVGTLESNVALWPTTRLNKQVAYKNQSVSSRNSTL